MIGTVAIMKTCTNCGASVSNEFAKVFGDNDDVVHICLSCTHAGAVFDGRSARPTPDDG